MPYYVETSAWIFIGRIISFFQLTFRIDIQQAKSIADSLIDFLDPWAWEEDEHIRHRMSNCIIGIDLHVSGPADAMDRVDDDIKCFLDYLLAGETFELSGIDYRSWGPEWGEPETDIPSYFPSDFIIYELPIPEIGEPSMRRRFSMNRHE